MAFPTERGVAPYKDGGLPNPFLIWLDRLIAAFPRTRVYEVSINLANVPATDEITHTETIVGLTTKDIVKINKPTNTASLSIFDETVTAADTLSFKARNFSGSGINLGAETYRIVATRI